MSKPQDAGLDLPQQFGRYRIARKLGQGGMGAVYLARDTKLDRTVALKVCTLVDSAKAMQRFQREAKAAAALRHQNICPVYDYDVHEGTAYITMAYIDGWPLNKWVAERPIDARGAALLVRKLAVAMQEAHNVGVIHRDLKPGNIVIDRKGEPVILDFGLARLTEAQSQSLSGGIIGTPAYMAPEQTSGNPASITTATDVYALGAVLYELLTGQPPFVGTVQAVLVQVVTSQPRPPRELNPEVPEAIQQVCLKAIAKEATARYPTMLGFAEALKNVIAKLPAGAPKPKSRPPAATQPTQADASSRRTLHSPDSRTVAVPPSRSGMWLGIGLVLVLILSLGAAIYFGMTAHKEGSGDSNDGNKEAAALPTDVVIDLGGGVTLELHRIDPGKFRMGSLKDEQDLYTRLSSARLIDEDAHEVEITRPFYLGRFEVTQEQYVHLSGKDNPSYFRPVGRGQLMVKGMNTQRFPVDSVSWLDAVAYCDELTRKHLEHLPEELRRNYRFALPTEAQWEYACRAGTTTPYSFGKQLNGKEANCDGTHPFGTADKGANIRRTAVVGWHVANAWGLYDMHGNVAEWCADDYDENFYRTSPARDPLASKKSPQEMRAVRGGSWFSNAWDCRAAFRGRLAPDKSNDATGFRVALRAD
jgi:formylglycine-generating enzyme required for sulfatase activity/serine/threonine protein kinase